MDRDSLSQQPGLQDSEQKGSFQRSLLQAWNKAQKTIKELNEKVMQKDQQILSLKSGQPTVKGQDQTQKLQTYFKKLEESISSKTYQETKKELMRQQSQNFALIQKSYQQKLQKERSKVKDQYNKLINQLRKKVQELQGQNNKLRAQKIKSTSIQALQSSKKELQKLIQTQNNNLRKLQSQNSKDNQAHAIEIQEIRKQLRQIKEESDRRQKQNKQIKNLQQTYKKEDMIKSAICLRAMDAIKDFQRVYQSQKKISDIKQFCKLITIDRTKSQNLIQLYDKSEVQTNFKKIINQVVQQFRSLKTDKQSEREDFQSRKKNLQAQISNLGNEKIKLQEQLRKTKNYSASQKEQIQKLQKNLKDKEDQLKQSLARQAALKQTMEECEKKNKLTILKLQNQYKELTYKYSNSQKDKENLNKQKIALSKQVKQKQEILKTQKAKLEQQIAKLKAQGRKDQAQITQNQQKIKGLETKIDDLNTSVIGRDNKIDMLQNQGQSLKIKLDEANNKIKQLIRLHQNTKKELTSQIANINIKLQDTQSKLVYAQKLASGFKLLNKFLPEISFFINREKIQFDLQHPEDSIKYLQKWFKARFTEAKFFRDSQIVERQNIDFLVREIQSFVSSNFSEVKLLYRFDPKNNTSFHQYIDGKENLLVLFKLSSNVVVGGFSCFPMEKLDRERARQIGYGKGFIFNLTKQMIFPIRRQPKMPVLTFDDYFFIFGNSELRLKPSERKFFSNFGVANSTFDNLGVPRLQFIEKEGNEVDCMQFECYQIKFKM